MNFLTPAALAFSALAIPLLVLYMLRTRRRRQEVASVYLWEKAGVAVTSAVPWQRPKITPLLILQLLALLVFAVLLARPFNREVSLLGPHTVFVIDTSGSMDMAGRLDDAKDRAISLIGDAGEANVISIVEAGPRPRVLAALARDPAELRDVVGDLAAGGGGEDLAGAISLARSLATPDRATRILLFSDGGVAEFSDLVEPVIGAEHLPFSATEDNVAITAFAGEGSDDGRVRLFVEVTNFGRSAVEVVLRIEAGEQPAVDLPFNIDAGARVRDGLRVEHAPGLQVTATLVGPSAEPWSDGIRLDDRAFLVMGAGGQSAVAVVGVGSVFLDALIESVDGFIPAAGVAPDVLILDGGSAVDVTAPAWLIRPADPPPGVSIMGTVENTAASFQRPGEPLLADVDLSELAIAEADVVVADDWLPLVKAGDVPLVLLGEVEGHRAVYFTFDLTESNLPVQVGFPILGTRILQYLAGQDATSLEPGIAGRPITLAPPPGYQVEVAMPSGEVRSLPGDIGLFEDTNEPGVYRVSYVDDEGEPRSGPVAVRQFEPGESAATSRSIATEPLALAAAESTAVISEWTAMLLGVLLLLILVEWWVGHGAPRPWRSRRRDTR